MNTSNFTITRTTVRSAGYAYPTFKVEGRVNGRRIRSQFKSEQGDIGEKQRLEIFTRNALDPIRPAVTRMTSTRVCAAKFRTAARYVQGYAGVPVCVTDASNPV